MPCRINPDTHYNVPQSPAVMYNPKDTLKLVKPELSIPSLTMKPKSPDPVIVVGVIIVLTPYSYSVMRY